MTTMTAKQKTDSYLSLLEIPPGYLNITGLVNCSPDSGLGSRAVVWLQGCLRQCPDCFNPQYQSFDSNRLISIDNLAKIIISNPHNEGVTFSGGEPFWQAPALTELAKQVKAAGLNVMAFSCFSLDRLQSPYAPARSKELLAQLDVLVDSFCVESIKVDRESTISQNQRAHIFNPALQESMTYYLRMVYSIEDFAEMDSVTQ